MQASAACEVYQGKERKNIGYLIHMVVHKPNDTPGGDKCKEQPAGNANPEHRKSSTMMVLQAAIKWVDSQLRQRQSCWLKPDQFAQNITCLLQTKARHLDVIGRTCMLQLVSLHMGLTCKAYRGVHITAIAFAHLPPF